MSARTCAIDASISFHGEEAVERTHEVPEINLILMAPHPHGIDLGSGIDGTQTAQEILRSRMVPIVFLTSHTEQKTVAKVKGISGYVVKESGSFVLLQSINNALQLFEAHKHLAAESEQRREAAERLRMISESIVDMVALVDQTGEAMSARDYLGGLIDEISAAHAGMLAPQIDFAVDDVPLCADRAFAVGAILTELMTNAMKYAFVGRSEAGLIRVRFAVNADRATMTISDNGVGFPPDEESNTTDSFGLMLVRLFAEQLRLFAEQLRGSISITSQHGTGTEAVLSAPYIRPSETSPA